MNASYVAVPQGSYQDLPAPSAPIPSSQQPYTGPVYYVQTQPLQQQAHTAIDVEDAACAQAGCVLSWIPICGWVNFCMNNSAPEGSKRKNLAKLSCYIATAVFVGA